MSTVHSTALTRGCSAKDWSGDGELLKGVSPQAVIDMVFALVNYYPRHTTVHRACNVKAPPALIMRMVTLAKHDKQRNILAATNGELDTPLSLAGSDSWSVSYTHVDPLSLAASACWSAYWPSLDTFQFSSARSRARSSRGTTWASAHPTMTCTTQPHKNFLLDCTDAVLDDDYESLIDLCGTSDTLLALAVVYKTLAKVTEFQEYFQELRKMEDYRTPRASITSREPRLPPPASSSPSRTLWFSSLTRLPSSTRGASGTACPSKCSRRSG